MTVTYNAEVWEPGLNSGPEWRFRHLYRQQPITAEPLPYRLFGFKLKSNSGVVHPSHIYNAFGDTPAVYQAYNGLRASNLSGYVPYLNTAQCYNLAYKRIQSRIQQGANLLVNLAERREALNMMTRRISTLDEAARAVKRNDPGAFHRALSTPKFGRSFWNPKNFAETWLEYWFGWKPLISDIYSAIQLIDGSLDQKVKGGCVFGVSEDVTQPYDFVIANVSLRTQIEGASYCGTRCWLEANDLSLYKANALGLVNPAVVVWETIPYSFVVDWFLPIGVWLSQFTDTLGLNISHASTSLYFRGSGSSTWSHPSLGTQKATYDFWIMDRFTALPSVNPLVPTFTGLSPTRVATALSLLTTRLIKG